MKTIKLSHILPISALGLTLGLFTGIASASDTSKPDAEEGTRMNGQQSQQDDGQMDRHPDLPSTTRSGAAMPGEEGTNPAGTDATRSVPGAPDVGTNPATEPGSDSN